MGKLVNSLLLIIAIEFSMILFLGIPTPISSLVELVTSPELFTKAALIDQIVTSLTLVGVAGIAIGTIFSKQDFLVFGGLSLIFLSYGATFFRLYQTLNALPHFGKESYIAIIITAPLIIIYVYTVLKFWRGSD